MEYQEFKQENEIYEKAEAVIKSCITLEHLIVCDKYLDLVKRKIGNTLFNQLEKTYENITLKIYGKNGIKIGEHPVLNVLM